MTIRDYLKRRRNKAVLFVLLGIAFCVLSAVFAPDSFWLNWLSLAALFAGLVAAGCQVLSNGCIADPMRFGLSVRQRTRA